MNVKLWRRGRKYSVKRSVHTTKCQVNIKMCVFYLFSIQGQSCGPRPRNFWFDHSTACNKLCAVGVS